jgi:branched-chain amino acid transport system permease protein
MFATQYGFVSPGTFAFSASILVLVVVIFGGMGSLIGSVVGAATIQWAIFFLRKHEIVQQEDIYMYLGALLIVMMIFRPQGMVPSRRRAREIGLAEKGVGTADAMSAPVEGT